MPLISRNDKNHHDHITNICIQMFNCIAVFMMRYCHIVATVLLSWFEKWKRRRANLHQMFKLVSLNYRQHQFLLGNLNVTFLPFRSDDIDSDGWLPSFLCV